MHHPFSKAKMSTPFRRIKSVIGRQVRVERDHLRSLRELPKSKYATRTCLTIIQPRRPRPLFYSHVEVYKMVESVATEMREAGVRPHTSCAFVLPNQLEAVVYFLALQWIGAVAIPIDPNLDQKALSALLISVSALTVVSPFVDEDERDDDPLFQKVSIVCKEGEFVHWMINRSTNKGVYLEMCGCRASEHSAWAGGAGDFRFDPRDTSFQLLSVHPNTDISIQISQRDICKTTQSFVDAYNLSEVDSALLLSPLYTMHGLLSLFSTLHSGGNIVVMDINSLSTDTIVQHMSSLRPKWFTAESKIVLSLLESLMETDKLESAFSSLSFIRCVGGMINSDILRKVGHLISVPVLHSYGTPETLGLVTTNTISDNISSTFGKAVGSVEIAIFDQQSRTAVSIGCQGMIGVYDKLVQKFVDDKDCESISIDFILHDEKMFFLTGDRGSLDQDGNLTVTDLELHEHDAIAIEKALDSKIESRKTQLEKAVRALEEARLANEQLVEEEARNTEASDSEKETCEEMVSQMASMSDKTRETRDICGDDNNEIELNEEEHDMESRLNSTYTASRSFGTSSASSETSISLPQSDLKSVDQSNSTCSSKVKSVESAGCPSVNSGDEKDSHKTLDKTGKAISSSSSTTSSSVQKNGHTASEGSSSQEIENDVNVIHDLLERIARLEERQWQLEELINKERDFDNMRSRLEASEENVRRLVEDEEMKQKSEELEGRLELVEEKQHLMEEDKFEEKEFENIAAKIQTIEENQHGMEEIIEKNYQKQTEHLQSVLQQIEVSSAMQVTAIKRSAEEAIALANERSRLSSKQEVKDLILAVQQAAAAANQSSRSTTEVVAAARIAAEAAESAAETYNTLNQKASDGVEGALKKTMVVSLDEVEQAIAIHPSIACARAFGRPDARFGTEVYCVVSLRAGARISEPWLKLHAQSMLPAPCVPKLFYYKEDLQPDESRANLEANKDLRRVAEVSGFSAKKMVKSPAWAPRLVSQGR